MVVKSRMTYPNFNEEKKLWKQGYKNVVGLDEAGRGPLAGPVVAAAVCVAANAKILLKGINDSKKLSEKQRENFYKILTNHKEIKWGIGTVSEKVIDRVNVLEATKLAMQKSFKKLSPDFLLVDGNFIVRQKNRKSIRKKEILEKTFIKGDQKIFSIAAASIIAKVTRDRIMKKYHKKYPKYGFDKHKGYGTVLHMENLKKFGLCKIHRKTFYPARCINMS